MTVDDATVGVALAPQPAFSRKRVLGSFLVLFVVYGIWQSGSVFLPAIVRSEGWSISATSLVFSVAFVVYGFVSPVVGWLVDRFGPLRVFRYGAVLTAAGLIAAALANSPLQLGVCYGVSVALGVAAVGVIPQAVYVRSREPLAPGRALGAAQAGLGLGPMVIVPLAGFGAVTLGWRWTLAALAVLAAACTATGLRLMARAEEPPEPRGDAAEVAHSGGSGFRAQLRSPATWALVVGAAFVTAGCMSVLLHQVSFLVDGGFTVGQAGVAAGGVAGISAGARIFWGGVTDRFPRAVLFAGIAVLVLAGVLLLRAAASSHSAVALVAYVLVFGLGYGAVSPLFPVLAEDVHGRSRLGTTFGLMGIGIGAGSGTGPALLGILRERVGSYDGVILLAVGAAIIGVLILSRAPVLVAGRAVPHVP